MSRPKTDRVGEKYLTNEGYSITILKQEGYRNNTIQFEDGTIVEGVSYTLIRKGSVRNKNKKSIYGIGCHGYGKYKGVDDNLKELKSYGTWRGMLRRCYYEPHIEQHPSYRGCSVHPSWHNYQNFALWFEENYIDGFELDKDILQPNCKVYSPETCCFIPREINNMFQVTIKVNKYGLPKGIRKASKNTYSSTYNDVYLGSYSSIEEAVLVYNIKRKEILERLIFEYKDKIKSNVLEKLREVNGE